MGAAAVAAPVTAAMGMPMASPVMTATLFREDADTNRSRDGRRELLARGHQVSERRHPTNQQTDVLEPNKACQRSSLS
jgi:hypothetical protein